MRLPALILTATACLPPPLPAECDPDVGVPLFADNDGDGFGRTPVGDGCPGPGLSATAGDCNDTLPQAFPGAREVCDGLDNDCNGEVDEGFPPRQWFPDEDGDGFGDEDRRVTTCQDPGDPWTLDGEDCDDTDELASPAAPERCDDGADNDCDTLVDCEDPDCDGGPLCLPACADLAIPSSTPFRMTGSTVGAGDDFAVPRSCAASAASDVAYWFVASETGVYTIDTDGSGFDTVLHVYEDCDSPAIACNDDLVPTLVSFLELPLVAGQGVLLVVDGFDDEQGGFVLSGSKP